jgi:hypothetical protein
MVGFPHCSLTSTEQPAFLRKLNTANYLITQRQVRVFHQAMFCISPKVGKTSGEMQNLSAIFAFFTANGGCQAYHPGVGRG